VAGKRRQVRRRLQVNWQQAAQLYAFPTYLTSPVKFSRFTCRMVRLAYESDRAEVRWRTEVVWHVWPLPSLTHSLLPMHIVTLARTSFTGKGSICLLTARGGSPVLVVEMTFLFSCTSLINFISLLCPILPTSLNPPDVATLN
jgi:hypothetical protein